MPALFIRSVRSRSVTPDLGKRLGSGMTPTAVTTTSGTRSEKKSPGAAKTGRQSSTPRQSTHSSTLLPCRWLCATHDARSGAHTQGRLRPPGHRRVCGLPQTEQSFVMARCKAYEIQGARSGQDGWCGPVRTQLRREAQGRRPVVPGLQEASRQGLENVQEGRIWLYAVDVDAKK